MQATHTEASVTARRLLIRTKFDLPQNELVHLLSLHDQVNLPFLECPVFEGQTNNGSSLGPMVMPPLESEWTPTVARKKVVYKSFRIPVGGPGLMEASEPPAVQRKDGDMEPVFWQAPPASMLRAIVGRCKATHVISLTAGNGKDAAWLVTDRICCFCFCMSQEHVDQVWQTVKSSVLNSMLDAKHMNFDAEVARAFATGKKAYEAEVEAQQEAEPGKSNKKRQHGEEGAEGEEGPEAFGQGEKGAKGAEG